MPRKLQLDAIEFLRNRIYLGAYDLPPADTAEVVYFTVDEELMYNPFHEDFGPLHIGLLYRFAVLLHHVLNDEQNQGRAVVLYSLRDVRQRSNTACLLCCYMVLVQLWAPHQVLAPIAQCKTPFMPFRDAGYLHADFELTIQDMVYGVWKAKERGMIDLTGFDLDEYERYERVDMGDFNNVSKDFIAFALPQQLRPGLTLSPTFRSVLDYFLRLNVQLVVRLNLHLYDANEFTKRGIQHIDMIFDDGTCPDMEYVRQFIGAAECVINNGGKVAVHCKAGLGRTGCLIGAHLIYTHGFTANECIAYMRFIRPGMVVGPQQHWLYVNQHEFRAWRHTMVLDNVPDAFIGGLFPLVLYEEFKQRHKKLQADLSAAMDEDSLVITPQRRRVSGPMKYARAAVPSTSPGQPRKGIYGNTNNGHTNNSDHEEYGDENAPVTVKRGDAVLTRTRTTTTVTTTISLPPGARRLRSRQHLAGERVVLNGGVRKVLLGKMR